MFFFFFCIVHFDILNIEIRTEDYLEQPVTYTKNQNQSNLKI